MNRIFATTLWGTILVAVAVAAPPPTDVRAIAKAVDDHYNRLSTLKADFVETYHGSGADRSESGTLWLKKPGKMRWEYRSPREKLFLDDGKFAWLYLPEERQVHKISVKKIDDLRSPLAFLLGKTQLAKELQDLSLATDMAPKVAGGVMLRGIPKGLGDRISEVLVEVTPESQISRFLIAQTDGSSTEYSFNNQQDNAAVPESEFHFSPPPQVEIIEGDFGGVN